MHHDPHDLTQFATRIPQSLHRRLKLHCVLNGVTLTEFVIAALAAKLGAASRGTTRRPPPSGRSRADRPAA